MATKEQREAMLKALRAANGRADHMNIAKDHLAQAIIFNNSTEIFGETEDGYNFWQMVHDYMHMTTLALQGSNEALDWLIDQTPVKFISGGNVQDFASSARARLARLKKPATPTQA